MIAYGLFFLSTLCMAKSRMTPFSPCKAFELFVFSWGFSYCRSRIHSDAIRKALLATERPAHRVQQSLNVTLAINLAS